MKRNFFTILGSVLVIMAGFTMTYALTVGQSVSNLNIRDSKDKPATIPGLGSKVLTIVYTDSDAADICDPISDALKARNYPPAKQLGIGISNMKDSPAPNWLIRKIIDGKIEKYKVPILTDVDLTVPQAWGLGNDVNNKSIFIVIGTDKKVKYVKFFDKYHKPAQADIDTVVNLVNGLVK